MEEEEGSRVLVAMKMDAKSRELLTWAVTKVARPGDQVVALHILPSLSSSSLTIEEDFDSLLATYEGFCNTNMIDLKLKVCKGSSLRKALVREATLFAVSKLILGVSDNTRSIQPSPTSIAKYCAKKLPAICSVLAVSEGKVVFERKALQVNSKAVGLDPPSCSVPHSTTNHSFATSAAAPSSLYCLLPAKKNHHSRRRRASVGLLGSKISAKNTSDPPTEDLGPSGLYCLLPPKYHSSRSFDNFKLEDNSTSPRLIDRPPPPEQFPGWPLLRRGIISERKKTSTERSKLSVVQWPMGLPDRRSRAARSSGKEQRLPEAVETIQHKFSSVCRSFSYEELRQATSDFSPENLVGEGGSSRVFKGRLPEVGKEIAAKILKQSETALNEFAMEIEIITRLQHKNIVSLLGFCLENDLFVLVYDFLHNGSLEECLHGKRVMSLGDRFKVAVGVAEALEYLHSGGDGGESIVHRDVKSSNILISQDFEPQLCDFGLATTPATATAAEASSDVVAGTFGYLAPEYFMYGRVTEKIDVYAFGVVLLELLSGRKPISTTGSTINGQQEKGLVIWAQKILQGGKVVEQLVDPCLRLGDEYNKDQMERMILAASLCVRRSLRSRPPIAPVLKLLQGDEEVLRWARVEAGTAEEPEGSSPSSDIRSHINLALLGLLDDDSLSVSSAEPAAIIDVMSSSVEDYLQRRWSRSLSFG